MSTIIQAGPYIAEMPITDTITEEVRVKLGDIFGEKDANGLAAKLPFEVRGEFESELNKAFWGQDWLVFIVAMLNRLQAYGFGQQAAAPAPSGPIAVTIQQEKPLGERSLSELLQLLVDKQGDPRRVLEVFKADSDVAKALAKTKDIIVPAANGGVNVAETVAYINGLALAFGTPRREVKGATPISVEEAFGAANMVIINAITCELDYVGQPNKYGVIISNASEELLKAIAWARATDHEYIRSLSKDPLEIEKYLQQIFTSEEELDRRWMLILTDFRSAIRRGDMEARRTDVILREDDALALFGSFLRTPVATNSAPPVHDEAYYERLVREKTALRPTIEVKGMGNGGSARNQVCHTLRLRGQGHIVRGTVVTGLLDVRGQGHSGDVIMAPGSHVDEGGMGHSISQRYLSFREIVELKGW